MARLNSSLQAMMLMVLMVLAPLSGCFGEAEPETVNVEELLLLDGRNPALTTMAAGEWHDFVLRGENTRLSVPIDTFIFVDDQLVRSGQVVVDENGSMAGKLLTTPYTNSTTLTVMQSNGMEQTITMDVGNGTPIVSGEAWLERMTYILSVCDDGAVCGGYINRWMGAGNPAFERAASYFHGHFEGLGYRAEMMRVFDSGNPTEPESLNVIAWKDGPEGNTCVQGMGAHMDIAVPGGPPGGGTWEGAYDNTAGSVAVMLYARAFTEMEFECDTFLALWSSEEEGLRGSNAFANNDCDVCLPQDKELRFYINMDMMGVSWPAHKSTGDPFPYHAWSGPDLDPAVQDVEITTVLDHVHRDILKAPMDLRIEGSYGAGCDQHWDDHYNLVMDVHEDTFGRSDHVTFRDLGAQTIFHLGAYDDDYPAYHAPTDTLENMITEVGGEDELKKSIEFVMWAAMLEFIIADQTPEVRNLGA